MDAATATSKELAEEVGVHWTTLARWRSGASEPSPESARKLAEVIGRRALAMLDSAATLDAEAKATDEGDR